MQLAVSCAPRWLSGLANAKRFAHLARLDLTYAYVSDGIRSDLAKLGPQVILDDPQSPDDDFREPVIR